MENITIDGVAAHACEGTADVSGGHKPLIWVQNGVDVHGLQVKNVYREERTYPTAFFRLDREACVKRLLLDNLVQKNLLGTPIPFIQLDGSIEDLVQGFVKEYTE